MRTWLGPVLLTLAITACGGKTSDPPTQGPVAPGQDCPEPGATSPADDGCNTCHCDETGWICGLTGCPPSDEPVPCGGRMGGTCAEDEYCGYEAGSGCGDDDAGSVCKPRPAECPEEHASVCGCDGETYESACLANAAGTGVAIDAPCLPIE